eukprot:Lithocolla_globosa_v1_NODE_3350_length_1692_cov_23.323152.p1 type:complete len:477 gc:universal NODE_3350_length_1692_cov_23.323152:1650-220(-)
MPITEESHPLVDSEEFPGIVDDKKPWYKRHIKKLCCCGWFVVFLLIFLLFIVPGVIGRLMGRYVQEVDISIQSLEIMEFNEREATVRLIATMVIDAPFEASGYTEDAIFSLLLPDPLPPQYGEIGQVFLPAVVANSTTLELDVVTTMIITSDRLFHVLLTDVLVNDTVTAYMEGDLTLTADVPVYGGITVDEFLFVAVEMDGMAGLDFNISYIDYVESGDENLTLSFNLSILNTGQFYASTPIELYAEDLDIIYEGISIGKLFAGELLLDYGWSENYAEGQIIRTAENEEAIGNFFSEFILGLPIETLVQGTAKANIGFGTEDESNPAVMDLEFVLPPLEDDLIEALYAPILGISPTPGGMNLTASGLMYNPLPFDIVILYAAFYGFTEGTCEMEIEGLITFEDLTGNTFFPGEGRMCLSLQIPLTQDETSCLLSGISDLLLYAYNGIFSLQIGEFATEVPFSYGPMEARIGNCRV